MDRSTAPAAYAKLRATARNVAGLNQARKLIRQAKLIRYRQALYQRCLEFTKAERAAAAERALREKLASSIADSVEEAPLHSEDISETSPFVVSQFM